MTVVRYANWERLDVTYPDGRVVSYRAWRDAQWPTDRGLEVTIQHPESPDRSSRFTIPDGTTIERRAITTRDDWMLR